MRRIPHLLLFTRLLLGPILLVAGLDNRPGVLLAGILLLATLTDIFDGIIARQLGVASEGLRRADSLVDTVFYLFVGVLVVTKFPTVLQEYWVGIVVVVALEISRALFDHFRFRRQAAYHMWSAKLWGVTLLLGFSELFVTGQAGILFIVAVVNGILTDIEGLMASIVLPEWRHDVPSIVHALMYRRAHSVSAR